MDHPAAKNIAGGAGIDNYQVVIALARKVKKIMDRLPLPMELRVSAYGIALRASSPSIP